MSSILAWAPLAAQLAALATAPPASRQQPVLQTKEDGTAVPDGSAPPCPVVEHANNIASMLPADPNTSTAVVKHLGIVRTEIDEFERSYSGCTIW